MEYLNLFVWLIVLGSIVANFIFLNIIIEEVANSLRGDKK